MKEWELCIQDVDRALKLCDEREQQAALYFNRGNAEVGLGNDNAAIQDFTRALERA